MKTAQMSTRRQDSVGEAFWSPGAALPLAFLLALAGGAAASVDGPGSDGEDVAKDGRWPANLATESGAIAAPAALRRLAFVENLGQWDTPASFVAILGTTVVQVQEGGFAVDALPEEGDERVLLRFELEGARDGVEPVGEEPLPGVRNYLLGNDPERWRSGAKSFAQVVYPGLYEGVDLRLREGGGVLEYDLYLAPGADLSAVVVRCEGVEGLEVDEQGGLRMRSANGTLRQSPPQTWCVLPSGEEQPVECALVVLDATRIGFRLAEYDPSLPVVIDPGLEWATFLGGGNSEDTCAMARKTNGEIVVAGMTLSPNFPLVPPGNTIGSALGWSIFVSILDATGSNLLRSTVLGGSSEDGALAVEVDSAGNVFLVGWTWSSDFPLTPGTAFRTTHQGGNIDVVVVELNDDLTQLTYGSYLGGTDSELAVALHLREPRILTIAGGTSSTNFPTTSGGVQLSNAGGNSDYFLCRLDLDQPPASQLLYGTYLGGSGDEVVMGTSGTVINLKFTALHEDDQGRVTLAGWTNSSDILTTPNAFHTTLGGPGDTYLARIDPTTFGLGGLEYATYIGGSDWESAISLAVDSAGVVTLGGYTSSADFQTTQGAYQELLGPVSDGFILRLDPSIDPPTNQLLYSTFLGGDRRDWVRSIVLDADGKIIAQGQTGDPTPATSNTFPTTCGAYQASFSGWYDAFLVYLDPAGNGAGDLLYSTFLGGSQNDVMASLAIVSEAPTLKVVAGGDSNSPGFPGMNSSSYQQFLSGAYDVVALQLDLSPLSSCPTSYCTAGTSASGCQATLSSAGEASATAVSGFDLIASGVEGAKDGLFFFGTNGRQANSWGSGTSFQCVVTPVMRGGLLTGTGTPGLCDGAFTQDLNARWCLTCPRPSHNPGAGATVQAQLWYRDPFNTSNQTTSLSDAIEFVIAP